VSLKKLGESGLGERYWKEIAVASPFKFGKQPGANIQSCRAEKGVTRGKNGTSRAESK